MDGRKWGEGGKYFDTAMLGTRQSLCRFRMSCDSSVSIRCGHSSIGRTFPHLALMISAFNYAPETRSKHAHSLTSDGRTHITI